MHSSTRRELLTGLQYLLIGIIAQCSVVQWFGGKDFSVQLLVWTAVFTGLGLVRLIILFLSDQFRRDQWQTISRRKWY